MNSVTGLVKSKFRPLLSPACTVKKIYSVESTTNESDTKASKTVEFYSTGHKGSENLTGEFGKIKCETKNFIDNSKSSEVPKSTVRRNDLNIQMLSEPLYRQIYGNDAKIHLDKLLIEKAKFELKKHGLWKDNVDFLKEVSLNLPSLKGKDIAEHFWNIGREQSERYKNLLTNFCEKDIPKPPENWVCQEGWTMYVEGEKPVSVPFPDDDALVFDVEVCVQLGELPTLATAVSSTAWYGWVCSDLAYGFDSVPTKYYRTDKLISFEGKNINKNQPRVIIGHNVSYDRARIKEQYYIKNSGMRFVDTMSLHNCIGGISTKQKEKFKKKSCETELESLQSLSCLSSLKEVYHLYCNGTLDKDQRNVFVTGNMSDVRNDFQNLMNYCANDVKATYEVFKTIYPVFVERFPHPVTLAGMLEMSTAFLPVNDNWNKFLADAEQTYDDLNNEITSLLAKKSDYACQLFHDDKYKNDLWMWDEDWSTQILKLNQTRRKSKTKESPINIEECDTDEIEKELDAKFEYLFALKDLLPVNPPFLPGYPLWYRNLLDKPNSEDWTPIPQLTTSKFITPKLLRLTWENFPLHYIRLLGWGILVADIYVEKSETNVPFKKLKELTLKNCDADVLNLNNIDNSKKSPKKKDLNSKCPLSYYRGAGIWCDHIVDNCSYFFKLPHSQGDLRNVGNPLSRDFSHLFFGTFLNSSDAVFEKVVDLGNKISYWRNNKERILNQMVVWLKKKELGVNCDEDISVGVIIPKVVVCGTITRRAMEPTWLTASKVTKNRIGSELRSMVQAPPGYHIVGADVDSQELWIASLIGDSHFAKTHGSTPIGWMTLSGTKSKGTDMHSVTAKAVGISRDHAKIINYARIYGAGMSYAKKLLQNFNPAMKDDEAYSKAKKMYALTKGKKVYKVKESMFVKFHEKLGQSIEVTDVHTALRLARFCNEKPENLFEKCHWANGTESAMFNRLEEIANSAQPRTPFLNCRLSKALEPKHRNSDFFSITRINWVVQSGAVDFLHLMLVCMRWLTNGKARYCFSFHDEVRYLVHSEERYNGALAMHITNLLVRAFCAYKVGIHDLPQSVAFFSSVEVDKTLRKEASDDCVTPSNPHGLEKKYGLPLGESLNIYEAIEKSNGTLAPFKSAKIRVSSLPVCDFHELYEKSFNILKCLIVEMSQATKRKHVYKEILQGELELPKENQQIVRVLASRGSNLHEVETAEQNTFLVSMPSKFRKNVWIKRGDYILVEPITEGDKVKAEMVKVLTLDYIKFLKKENHWPYKSDEDKEGSPNNSQDLGNTNFINNNRNFISDESNSGDESD